MTKPEIQTLLLLDDGTFPNNGKLPLVLFQQAFDPTTKNLAETVENTFHANAWQNSWHNGIFTFHHYHSTAHEVLGIYAGRVKAQFGGQDGQNVTAKAGDVIIVPAGVSHKNLDQSPDFRCVGAYPEQQSPDMQYGKPGERPQADQNISSVVLPKFDPVHGKSGPLLELWAPALRT